MLVSKATYFSFALATTLIVSAAGAATPVGTPSAPITAAGITPYLIDGENRGGNRSCEEVGAAYFGNPAYFERSSQRSNFSDGLFDAEFPAGLRVQTDGSLVSFDADFGIGAVIVKGSQEANTYVYEPQVRNDAGLAAPPNASGGPAGLSNLTFCWNPEPTNECWKGETAWSEGARYRERGGWAMFTAVNASDFSVALLAGQHHQAGTVGFSSVTDGVEITISLAPGFRFKNVDENVKIQGYADAPSTNPQIGRFAHKFDVDGESFTAVLPAANFFGVHVDVERLVECPLD